jgi:thiol-disulfide isomerase/thioredoxin
MKRLTNLLKLVSFATLCLSLLSSKIFFAKELDAESQLKQFSIPNPVKGVIDLSSVCNLKKGDAALPGKKVLDAILAESKKTNRAVLMRFVTKTCPLCKSSSGIFNNIAKRFDTKAILVNVQYEDFREIGEGFAVTKAPTYILFNHGAGVWRDQGAVSESTLNSQLTKYISN